MRSATCRGAGIGGKNFPWPARRMKRRAGDVSTPGVYATLLLRTKRATFYSTLLFSHARGKSASGAAARWSSWAGLKSRIAECGWTIQKSGPITVPCFERSFRWRGERTREHESHMARKPAGFLRRGAWICRLFLYADHSGSGRVFFSVPSVPRFADVERFSEFVQGLRRDGIVAHCLFYAASRESGICALEISNHQTLDPRAGPVCSFGGAS